MNWELLATVRCHIKEKKIVLPVWVAARPAGTHAGRNASSHSLSSRVVLAAQVPKLLCAREEIVGCCLLNGFSVSHVERQQVRWSFASGP